MRTARKEHRQVGDRACVRQQSIQCPYRVGGDLRERYVQEFDAVCNTVIMVDGISEPTQL
jgi:hypothetical protein